MAHQVWSTLIKYGISPDELYFLDCCRFKVVPNNIINFEQCKITCIAKGFLKENGILTDKGLSILDEFEIFLVKSKKKVTSSVLGNNFLEKINEYRNLFPSMKLPSGVLARQSVQELKDKFIWFFKNYPEYTWEDVLDATDAYIFEKSKSNYQFMSNSSFFIQKTDIKSKVNSSPLADCCAFMKEGGKIVEN